jgi:hypothetical protein
METTLIKGRAAEHAQATVRCFMLLDRLGHDLTGDMVLVPSERWKVAMERRLAAVLPEDNRPQVVHPEHGLRGVKVDKWLVDDVREVPR